MSQKRYRYTGKERDEECGLYYHGARYYAPWLARWGSVDPAGFSDGVNRFAYCRGQPISKHDPTGLGGEDGSPEVCVAPADTYPVDQQQRVILLLYQGGPFGDDTPVHPDQATDPGTYPPPYFALEDTAVSASGGRDVVAATIAPSYDTQNAAEVGKQFIAEHYRPGDIVVVYGNSAGGDAALRLSRLLGEGDPQIDLLLTADAAWGPLSEDIDRSVPGSVKENVNWYQTTPEPYTGSRGDVNYPAPGSSAVVRNYDVTNRDVSTMVQVSPVMSSSTVPVPNAEPEKPESVTHQMVNALVQHEAEAELRVLLSGNLTHLVQEYLLLDAQPRHQTVYRFSMYLAQQGAP